MHVTTIEQERYLGILLTEMNQPSLEFWLVLEKVKLIQIRNFHRFVSYSTGVTCSIIITKCARNRGEERKNFDDYLQLFKFGCTMISFDLCTVLLTAQRFDYAMNVTPNCSLEIREQKYRFQPANQNRNRKWNAPRME